MMFNTITNQTAETVPGGIYEGIDYHGAPPADVAERAGWVDVTPEIQEIVDAALAAAAAQAIVDADAAHEATAPGADLSSWSKREKCLLLITFKLAKEHWPNMTQQQFFDNVKTEWDSVK